jgi:hypothetical protein
MRVILERKNPTGSIPMYAMLPGQIGEIVDPMHYTGEIVMRTLNEDRFEVMSLTMASAGRYWNKLYKDTPGPSLAVRLLEKGDVVTLEA